MRVGKQCVNYLYVCVRLYEPYAVSSECNFMILYNERGKIYDFFENIPVFHVSFVSTSKLKKGENPGNEGTKFIFGSFSKRFFQFQNLSCAQANKRTHK